MKMILQFANIVIIAYGLYKFLGKPHSTLEQRIAVVEKEIEEIKREQEKHTESINGNDEATEVIQESLLALIEFEMQFCTSHNEKISEELRHAKDKLHSYLTKKR